MEINEALKQAICKHTLLDISEQELTIPCDLIGDPGINSIDLIMIIIELEEVLQISIDEEDVDFSQLYELEYFNTIVEKLVNKE